MANALTIVLDSNKPSFLSVLDFLSDTRFRSTCLAVCRNPIALRNWRAIEGWDGAQRKAAVANVEAKFGTILLSPLMHRTLTAERGTFHPTKTQILIADLSRAKIGDNAAKLIGTLLISRTRSPIYINDFGFLASDYISSLFSKGGYTVTLQFLRELSPQLQQTVLGFQERYIFRTTPEDAERLKFGTIYTNVEPLVSQREGEFQPHFDIEPPATTGRLKAVLNRSIACHTRRAKN